MRFLGVISGILTCLTFFIIKLLWNKSKGKKIDTERLMITVLLGMLVTAILSHY